MWNLIRRVFGFGALPLLSSVAPLLILPIIARVGSASDWVAIGIGQAVGVVVGVVGAWGWNISGSPRVVQCNSLESRVALYSTSFWARAVVFPIVLGFGVLVTVIATTQASTLLGCAVCVGMSSAAFNISWYAIGVGSPGMIARFQAFPRVLGMVLSIPLILFTGWLYWYPLGILVGVLVGLLSFHLKVYGSWLPQAPSREALRTSVISDLRLAGIDGLSVLVGSAPLPVGGSLLSVSTLAGLTSSDKIFRFSQFSISALANGLQAWVLSSERVRRRRFALIMHSALGIAGFFGIALLGEVVSERLFGAELRGSGGALVWYGVAFLCMSMSTPLVRNTLIPEGLGPQVFRVSVLRAAVGVTGMVVFGRVYGASGVAAGFALGEVIQLVWFAIICLRFGRSEAR